MNDDRMTQSLLLDLYGKLLTEKQRECCELHYNEDLSLSEIAEQSGVSRQGVWDNIRRGEAALREMEEKTGILRRLTELQQELMALREQLQALRGQTDGPAERLAEQAVATVDRLLERGL